MVLLSGLRVGHCCELRVGHRLCLDLALLWLWSRLAAAAPFGPLAWELPHAMDPALKRPKKKKKKSKINVFGKHNSLKKNLVHLAYQ